jgi:hypothetical protein
MVGDFEVVQNPSGRGIQDAYTEGTPFTEFCDTESKWDQHSVLIQTGPRFRPAVLVPAYYTGLCHEKY